MAAGCGSHLIILPFLPVALEFFTYCSFGQGNGKMFQPLIARLLWPYYVYIIYIHICIHAYIHIFVCMLIYTHIDHSYK